MSQEFGSCTRSRADLEQLKISPFSLSLAMLGLFFADHARSFLNWKEKML
jgi:hypothetical protein